MSTFLNSLWISLLAIGLQPDLLKAFESCPEEPSTMLLQTGLKLGDEKFMISLTPSSHLSGDQDMQVAEVEKSMPIYYFHVPKTGGTPFTKALLLMPGICPSMSEEDREALITADKGPHLRISVAAETQCNVADLKFAGHDFADHFAVGVYYQQYVKRHGFTIMRQAEQRIMSGYYAGQHSWSTAVFGRDAHNVSEYAQAVAGCAVKQLTRIALDKPNTSGNGKTHGSQLAACGDPNPVTSDEADLAIKRLHGFAFVGILESWDISICLLHAKFGGSCASYELEDGHATDGKNATEYDTSELDGFVDWADGKMYAEAKRMFENDLQKYGVTVDSCSECFAQAAPAF